MQVLLAHYPAPGQKVLKTIQEKPGMTDFRGADHRSWRIAADLNCFVY